MRGEVCERLLSLHAAIGTHSSDGFACFFRFFHVFHVVMFFMGQRLIFWLVPLVSHAYRFTAANTSGGRTYAPFHA